MNKTTKQYIVGLVAVWALLGGLLIGLRNSSAADATTTCVNDTWTATLNGRVDTSDSNTDAWFQWGEDTSVPYPTPHQTFNSSSNFSEVLTDLKENTTYYFQVAVQNQYLSDRGEIKSFHTGTCTTPTPTPTPANVSVSINASPSNVNAGNRSDLSWNSSGANGCTATSGGSEFHGQGVPTNSTTPVYPTSTTTYRITCYGDNGGSAHAETTVTVNRGSTTSTQSTSSVQSNSNIQAGNLSYSCLYNPYRIQLNWTSGTNANSNGLQKADVEPNNPERYWGWLSTNDTQRSYTDSNVVQGNTYTYRVKYAPSVPSNEVTPNCGGTPPVQTCQETNATNYGGTLPCQYNNNQNQPKVDISADDTNIDQDESTTVRWTSTNATSCTGTNGRNGWSGSKDTGSRSFYTGSLSSDTTYTITCYNNAGVSDTDSVTVRVSDNNNNNNQGPDVTTRAATSVSSNRATLNGRVDGNGLTTRAWFEYGTTRNMSEETRDRSYGSGSTSYDESINGLRANTTYYFRAVAENAEDIVYGSILTFYTGDDYITPNIQTPTVVLTADQTSLAYGGATTVRWYSVNATSCYASGGSLSWAGTKNVGSGTFYTNSLTSSKTYTITCSNSSGYPATDSVTVLVRGQVLGTTTVRPTGNALILLSSAVDRYQAIVPTLDNTRPHPGDEINYAVTYQNVGNASATNLVLRLDLPYEVDYMHSTPSNPTRSGQTLIWSLGTLKAGASGTVTVRVRLRNDVPGGTVLNFPATLTYTDPSGYPQSVSANISATVWGDSVVVNNNYNDGYNNKTVLGASVIGAGFFPGSLFEWLLLLILILVLIVLIKYIFNQPSRQVVVTH